MTNKRLLIVVNVDWFFLSHRLPIALRALTEGYDVYLLTTDTGFRDTIEKHGIKFYDISIKRSGTNFFSEFILFCNLYYTYKKIKPDIIHHITLKPIIYGTFISKFINQKSLIVNAISGLGFVFINPSKFILRNILIFILRFSCNRDNLSFIFQNNDDYLELLNSKIFSDKNKIFFIKGSGVDLIKYYYAKPSPKNKIRILFPSRMLWDKGVKELREATDILSTTYINKVEFILCGNIDNNKSSVTKDFLNEWSDGEYVNWIGYQENMINIFINSDIVVLPSYREGLPKALIEACAIGRPIITTNSIGCKDCVDNNINGILINVKSGIELANALEKLIIDSTLRLKMGLESRKKAELEFDINHVINVHMLIYTN
jgi:glycosyltransferase involved in cell wall biosynthesis